MAQPVYPRATLHSRQRATAWEQRKLGEVAILSSAARVHKDEWVAEGVPFLRSSNVVASFRGETAEQLYISEELYGRLSKRSGKLNKGDILLTGGGSIGIPYLIPDESDVYSKDADLLWVKTNGRTDPIFLYWQYAAPSMRCYLGGVSHVGTIAHYTIEQAKETPIVLPDTDEQKIIGSFFQRLDSLSTLHQRK